MFASIRSLTIVLVVLALLFGLVSSAHADEHGPGKVDSTEPLPADLQGYVPGAAYLEGRIRAPCCWNQTIDIHGSEPSNELRREIRRRLRAGESKEAIEASLVERFGDRILAVPPTSPLKSVAAVLAVVLLGAGVGAYFLLRRWRARGVEGAAKKATQPPAAEKKALEARLDAELQALDE